MEDELNNEQVIDEVATEPAEPAAEPTEPEADLTEREKLGQLLETYAETGDETKPSERDDDEDKGGGESVVSESPTEKSDEKTEPEKEEDIEDILSDIKSERGKNRIRELMSGHKALQNEYESVRKATDDFANIIRETQLSPEGVAQTFEFCRLVGQGDEASLNVALKMLDEQRADICKRLGVKAPGIDPLAEFDDLKNAVDTMEMPEDKALELAKLRRMQAMQRQSVQQQQVAEQQQQEYARRVQTFSQQANALFSRLQASDPSYAAKEAKIIGYLQDPTNVQNIISKFQPEQWLDQLQFMYNAIPAQPPVKRPSSPAPLRSRPAQLGNTNVIAKNSNDLVGQLIDNMGI